MVKISHQNILSILETVADPEVPVLSIIDLGIVRDVLIKEDKVSIVITPTYSGCPAMDVISMNIKMALLQQGFKNIQITYQLSPAWTTDWMSKKGKEKLKTYGIAPPVVKSFDAIALENLQVECPHCHLPNTKLISQFGSTSCKALYKCNECAEVFDYFKCH